MDGKCQACGGTGVITVYSGEGDFEFYTCEYCGGKDGYEEETGTCGHRSTRIGPHGITVCNICEEVIAA